MKTARSALVSITLGLGLPTFGFATVSTPSIAWADDSIGEDEVSLKNGGMVRGTVISLEPGTKVVIREAGAKSPRTIPWGEVADVQRGKFKAATPGEAGPGYATEKAVAGSEVEPAAGGLGVVKLHIDSPRPVKVVEHLGTSYAQAGSYGVRVEHAAIVCGTPCDKTIDGSNGQEFIVEGDGVPASETFVLSDRQGDTVVHVDPGSYGMIYGGNAMLYVGVLGMITGLSLTITGAIVGESTGDDIVPIGGILIGGSSALIGGGIALLVLGDTDVVVESKPMQMGSAAGSPRPASVAPRYWAGEF
jgi:hypothetical protein